MRLLGKDFRDRTLDSEVVRKLLVRPYIPMWDEQRPRLLSRARTPPTTTAIMNDIKSPRRRSPAPHTPRPIVWIGGRGLPKGVAGKELAALGHPLQWQPLSSKTARSVESLEPVLVVVACDRVTAGFKKLLAELSELKPKIDLVVFQLRRRDHRGAPPPGVDGVIAPGASLVRQLKLVLQTMRGAERHKLAGYRARKRMSRMSEEVARLRDLAVRDDLTCLYNLRFFNRSLDTEHQRAQRFERHYSLIFLDLDGLREVNTRLGHLAGGQVLKEVGEFLMARIRRIDVPARIGGDEFVIILPETDKRAARLVAERLRRGIQSLQNRQGQPLGITASSGVACFPEDGERSDIVLARADRALYEAKARGKNRVCGWGDFQVERDDPAPKASVHDPGEARPLDLVPGAISSVN